MKIAAASLLLGEQSVLRYSLATQEQVHRPATHFLPLIRRIVGAVLQDIIRQGNSFVRVPKGNVSIGPDRNRAFARVKPVKLGMVGR